MLLYEDAEFYIQTQESEIPWLVLFTKEPYKELGDMPKKVRRRLWDIYDIIEQEMQDYYKPTKINMASFANMLPRVHIHIMARFEHDSYFPNSMWGEKVRESDLHLGDEDLFHKRLLLALHREAREQGLF